MPRPFARPPDLTLVALGCLTAQATGAVAQLALALRLEHSASAWAVSGLWLAGTVPSLALAPLTGLWLDRVDTVRLLRWLQFLAAIVDLGLALVPGTGAVLALAVPLGLAASTTAPGILALTRPLARSSGVAEERALTRIQAAEWAGATLGPLIGAGLVVAGGTRLPLLADALSLGLLGLALGALRARRPAGARRAGEGGLASLGAGITTLLRSPELRRLLSPILLVITCLNGAGVIEVFLATRVFRAGPVGYGALVALWGLGMVLGILLTPRLLRGRPTRLAAAGSGAAAVGLLGAGLSPAIWPALLAYLVGGVGNGLEMASVRIALQRRTPDRLRGRVFAAYLGLAGGASALGATLGGGLVDLAGPRLALLLVALPALLAAATLGILGGRRGEPRPRLGRPPTARLS